MNKLELKYIILNAKYHTKYEPILDLKSFEIFAYEGLSKFEIDNDIISTEEIFRQLHQDTELFFRLEKRNKQLQVEGFDFAHGKRLFLNFDADICNRRSHQEYWEEFLDSCKNLVVVEITENGNDDEKSANVMREFSMWLKSNNIDVALDDFAQEGSMFSFFIMNNSDYIKIDKSFIKLLRKNRNYFPYLKGVIETIRLNKQKSIIEGIETLEDLNLAKELNCDYVQGFYFSHLNKIK